MMITVACWSIVLAQHPLVEAPYERILALIAYSNQAAKPFQWIYTGHPLTEKDMRADE